MLNSLSNSGIIKCNRWEIHFSIDYTAVDTPLYYIRSPSYSIFVPFIKNLKLGYPLSFNYSARSKLLVMSNKAQGTSGVPG